MTTSPSTEAAVVDASLAAKWVLRDESDVEIADALLRGNASGTLTFYAPRQIEVEVAAAIRRAVLNERLTVHDGEQVLAHWLGLLDARLRIAENATLLPDAFRRALQMGITLFDALYVVLAEQLGVPFITADHRSLRSAAGVLPIVHALHARGKGQQPG